LAGGCTGAVVRTDWGGVADCGGAGVGDDVGADVGGASDHWGLVIHHRDGEGAGGGAASGCHHKGVGGAHGEAGAAGQACGLAGGCAGAVVRADGGGVADRGGALVLGLTLTLMLAGHVITGAWLSTTVTVKEQVAVPPPAVTTKVLVVTPTGKLAPLAGLRFGWWCAGAVVRADRGRVADRGGAGVGDDVGADVGRAGDHWGLVVHHRDGEGAGGCAASGCHDKGVGGDAHGEAGAAGQACGLAGGCAGAVVRADWGGVADVAAQVLAR
jgi:hypothetical protein